MARRLLGRHVAGRAEDLPRGGEGWAVRFVGRGDLLGQAKVADVRWRDDGVAPTATVGMVLPAGGELRYDGNLSAIRFIESAASAQLNVAFYS